MRQDVRLLRLLQAALLTLVVLAFPVAAFAVFGLGQDRETTADILACIYAFGLYVVFFSPLLPLPGLERLTAYQRIEQMVFVWFWVTFITHCSWELGWLLMHEAIIAGYDNPLFYTWWAYIDGGDSRYASADPTLIVMEILSVSNGLTGLAALYLWFRRPQWRRLALMMFTATAVVHLYSTSLYFLTEIIEGFPNVNTTRFFDIGIKFILANSPWLVMPCVVLYWVWHQQPITDRTHFA